VGLFGRVTPPLNSVFADLHDSLAAIRPPPAGARFPEFVRHALRHLFSNLDFWIVHRRTPDLDRFANATIGGARHWAGDHSGCAGKPRCPWEFRFEGAHVLRDQRHVRDALQQVVSARPGETKEAHAQRLQRDYRSMQVALSGAH
jgi:hypothetical protein